MVKIVVLCDGTWCGRATDSNTNVELIYRALTGQHPEEAKNGEQVGDIVPGYFDGIGLNPNESFFDYIFNGATGYSFDQRCKELYKFIAENYNNEREDKVWMFGLSRGAYTVRCVAGMIHNCGIVRKPAADNDSPHKLDNLVNEVYNIYRSRDPRDSPSSRRVQEFRNRFSHAVVDGHPPIKFMGLFDTVGALGIPRLNAGRALDYAELYDQEVSTDVQHVFQALSMHDTLSLFEPCFVRRGEGFEKRTVHRNVPYSTEEKWFPGCHYDIGRQTFYFARDRTGSWLGKLGETVNLAQQLALQSVSNPFAAASTVYKAITNTISNSIPTNLPDLMQRAWGVMFDHLETRIHEAAMRDNIGVIHPTPEYADAVLNWMLEKIKSVDETMTIHSLQQLDADHEGDPDSKAARIERSGCVYPKMVQVLQMLVPFAGPLVNQLLQRDRRIPLDTDPEQIYVPAFQPPAQMPYTSQAYETYQSLRPPLADQLTSN